MKNVSGFLIDNSATFQFAVTPNGATGIRVLNIDAQYLGDLVLLAKKENLNVTTNGGITITQPVKVIAPATVSKKK